MRDLCARPRTFVLTQRAEQFVFGQVCNYIMKGKLSVICRAHSNGAARSRCLLLCARRPPALRPADSRSALAAAGRSLPQVNTIIRCWALLVLQAIKSPNWHRNIKWLACGFACRRSARPGLPWPPHVNGRFIEAAALRPPASCQTAVTSLRHRRFSSLPALQMTGDEHFQPLDAPCSADCSRGIDKRAPAHFQHC